MLQKEKKKGGLKYRSSGASRIRACLRARNKKHIKAKQKHNPLVQSFQAQDQKRKEEEEETRHNGINIPKQMNIKKHQKKDKTRGTACRTPCIVFVQVRKSPRLMLSYM